MPLNEVRDEERLERITFIAAKATYTWDALCRAIEAHEAFRREVSDVVKAAKAYGFGERLERFIIPKPVDPLVEALGEINGEGGFDNFDHYARNIRASPRQARS
jgi:hypothetical protein